MLHFNSWQDLEKIGIVPLTGESCSYIMRILCDLTGSGEDLLKSYFGIPSKSKLADPWNRGSLEDPHVSSILLDRNFNWADLVCYWAFRNGSKFVIVDHSGDCVMIPEESDNLSKGEISYYGKIRQNMAEVMSGPQENGRAIHSMSGRSA